MKKKILVKLRNKLLMINQRTFPVERIHRVLENVSSSYLVNRNYDQRGRTLVRLHLIPYPNSEEKIRLNSRDRLYDDDDEQRRSEGYAIPGSCYHYHDDGRKKRRNRHVEHLPSYQKITNAEIVEKLGNEICTICHGDFSLGEYYRELPLCGHIFHKKCVDKWLKKDVIEMRCPLCRTSHSPPRGICDY
jgi:hypothetical protein